MKMDKVAGSGNDEFYTPLGAIMPLIPYLKPKSFILCPFDTDRSAFVRLLRDQGHSVLNSHLSEGQDFFEYNGEFVREIGVDYIISNPPYSVKELVLDRLFSMDIPFAMLVGIAGLFEARRFKIFSKYDFEILLFDKRISYFRSYDDAKPAINPPYSSVFVCHKVLPQQICFAITDRQQLKKI